MYAEHCASSCLQSTLTLHSATLDALCGHGLDSGKHLPGTVHTVLQAPAALALTHMLLRDPHSKAALAGQLALTDLVSVLGRLCAKQLRATSGAGEAGAPSSAGADAALADQYRAAQCIMELSAIAHLAAPAETDARTAAQGVQLLQHAQRLSDAVLEPVALPANGDADAQDAPALLAAVAALAAAPDDTDGAQGAGRGAKRRKTGAQSDWHLLCSEALMCTVAVEATAVFASSANNLVDTISYVSSQQEQAEDQVNAPGPSNAVESAVRQQEAAAEAVELSEGLASLRGATWEALRAAMAHLAALAVAVKAGEAQAATLVAAANLLLCAAEEALPTISQGMACSTTFR